MRPRCTVEFAPYQSTPKPATKRYKLEGTVEQDPDFQAFANALESGVPTQPGAGVPEHPRDGPTRPAADGGATVETPLMQYLRQKHEGTRDGGKPKVSRKKPRGAELVSVEVGGRGSSGKGGRRRWQQQGATLRLLIFFNFPSIFNCWRQGMYAKRTRRPITAAV